MDTLARFFDAPFFFFFFCFLATSSSSWRLRSRVPESARAPEAWLAPPREIGVLGPRSAIIGQLFLLLELFCAHKAHGAALWTGESGAQGNPTATARRADEARGRTEKSSSAFES